MNEYVPKVGDKVKATLRDTVVVGEVEDWGNSPDTGYVSITPQGLQQRSSTIRCWRGDGWAFEQIVSVPTKFGAVIRRADGEVFILAGPDDDCEEWKHRESGWWGDEEATFAGFTVLFEGVDE